MKLDESEILKKMAVIAQIESRGEQEALRLYPEMKGFIESCRGKTYEQVKKELFDKLKTA